MQIERLGPYQIVGKLGRGGMGTVFEGVNLETGEPAAVKTPVPRPWPRKKDFAAASRPKSKPSAN